ncbi:hypothetical protein Tco_1345840 [Tanacetum coccineum]
MRTHSQARRLRQHQRQQQQVPPNLVEPPKDTMADNRTMAELLQAPTEGYEDAIVVPEIAATNILSIKPWVANSCPGTSSSSDMTKRTHMTASYERFHLRVSPDVAELKDMVRALLLDKQNISVPAPAPVKRVSKVVLHAVVPLYRNCPATDSNNYLDNIQEIRPQAAATNSNKEIRLPVRHDGKPYQTTRFSSHATQQPSQQSESLEPESKPKP